MRLNYRPEIDGLRSIAVFAVILYHASFLFNHNIFKGGFLGVDIFFVISGYLISSLILKELETTGKFSFLHFYERRVRRILPALFVVMLVSLPFAYILLLPDNIVQFSESILASIFFNSNHYFHYTGLQYGALSGALVPFLHTWSLSIEEQFYIMFPLLLLLCFLYFRKYLTHIIILGILSSLFMADWASHNHPSFNYLTLPSRGWELLAGALLARLEISNGDRVLSNNIILNQTLPILGLLLIIHSIFFFEFGSQHPSFYTLSPIIGVMLIIWFSNKDGILTKIISSKIFVGFGLISYSLYLWHFPVFAFSRIVNFTDGIIFRELFLGFLIIGLSIVTYFAIEKPFRNKKLIKGKTLLISIISVLILLIFFTLSMIYKEGLPSRFNTISFLTNHYQITDKENSYFKNIPKYCYKGKFELSNIPGVDDICGYGDRSHKKVYLLGDSHMKQYLIDLTNRLHRDKKKISTVFIGEASYYSPNIQRFVNGSIDKKFNKINNVRNDFLNSLSDSIIIWTQRWNLDIEEVYFDNNEGGKECFQRNFIDINLRCPAYPDRFSDSEELLYNKAKRQLTLQKDIIKTINNLLKNNNKVILIYPVPEVGWYVTNEILMAYYKRNIKLNRFDFLSTSYELYSKRNLKTFEILNSISHKNLYRIYPHKIFCNNEIKNKCNIRDNYSLYYWDDDHLTIYGSSKVNSLILEKIDKIN